MGREDDGGIGQGEEPVVYIFVKHLGIALLKIGSAAAANQKGVTGKHLAINVVVHTATGVAGCGDGFNAVVAEPQLIAIFQRNVDGLDTGGFAKNNFCTGFLSQ